MISGMNNNVYAICESENHLKQTTKKRNKVKQKSVIQKFCVI